MNKLLENHRVQLTTAISVLVFMAGLLVVDTTWKVNVARDLREIREKQTEFGWDVYDQDRWISQTERINRHTGWVGADLDKISAHP